MLNRAISNSVQLVNLASDTHRLLFTWAIAHLDVDGRISGDPRVFRGLVCPMLGHVTETSCAIAMADIVQCGLAYAYEDDMGQLVLLFNGFLRQQGKLRVDREPASKFGNPPADCPQFAGNVPAWLRRAAGDEPAQCRLNLANHAETQSPRNVREMSAQSPQSAGLIEGKVREVKLRGLLDDSHSPPVGQGDPESDKGPELVLDLPPTLTPELKLEPPEPKGKKREPQSTMIPEDWQPPDELYAWGEQDPQVLLPEYVQRKELAYFRDHFRQMPGRKGYKSDWTAAWRNWLRKHREFHPEAPKPMPIGPPAPPPPAAFLEFKAELEAKRKAAGESTEQKTKEQLIVEFESTIAQCGKHFKPEPDADPKVSSGSSEPAVPISIAAAPRGH